MHWQDIEDAISAARGAPFKLDTQSSIGGGCINSAMRISGGGRDYFIKLNAARLLNMFEAEADGLRELVTAQAVRVPTPICTGTTGTQAFIVMEYLALNGRGGAAEMAQFGEQLAQMHRYTKDRFGWQRDNTIGSTAQPNAWLDDWIEFWRERRLGFQLQLAAQRGIGTRTVQKGEKLAASLDSLFAGYQPRASLLHGDLWSGNYGISEAGEPVIFDPAVYFGDREADLAMTELFGGFGRDFYAAYHASWPLDAGYATRKTLYNLYHILNHFNLFGGGYGAQADGLLDRLLAVVR